MDVKNLIEIGETDYIEFKSECKKSPTDHLHLLLCMMNTNVRREKYILFGVSDDKKVVGIEKKIDSSFFNNMLATAPLNMPFSIRIESCEYEGKNISVVIVPENEGHLYVPTSNKYRLKKNAIYTRNGCTNTGTTDYAAPSRIIQILDKRQMPLDLPTRENTDVFDRFLAKLKDYDGWGSFREYDPVVDAQVEAHFFKHNMDFGLKLIPHLEDFREPWANTGLDSSAYAERILLRFRNQSIAEKYCVTTDGGGATFTYPNTYNPNQNYRIMYCYYVRDSINYHLNFILSNGSRDQIWINRLCDIYIPVFDSKEEAERCFTEDFNSKSRKYLSFTLNPESREWSTHRPTQA